MRMMFAVLAMVGCLAMGLRASAAGTADLLTQVQGADVLSDLLTYTATRADVRVHVMRAFLREIGKSDEYDEVNPLVRMPGCLSFEQALDGAIIFIQSGGDAYADPSLKGMDQSQLTQQFASLQKFNRDEFLHVMQQREATGSMRAYLISIGEFGHYTDWAKGRLPATNPGEAEGAPLTPEQAAARIDELVKTIEEIHWKKAKAMGMSREEFDQKWQQDVQQYHDSIINKIDGMHRLAAAFAQSEVAASGSPYGGRVNNAVDAGNGPAAPSGQPGLAPPVNSQYTKSSFSSKDDAIWNAWTDNYEDTRYRR